MKKVQGNDCFQRINFLYQIGKEISSINPALSSYYGNLILNVAKKNVLKIHPNIKRQICKNCHCFLNNDSSSIKYITKKKGKFVQQICKVCGHQKSFKANKAYKIWLDKELGVVEVIK